MIRLGRDGKLTVKLSKRSRSLTGRAQPCTNPDCPCQVVFFFMSSPNGPGREVVFALDVAKRRPAPLQVVGPGGKRDEQLAGRVAARFSESDWATCARLLGEGKGDATPDPSGSMTVITPGGALYPNGPCFCGSGRAFERCCASIDGDETGAS